MSLSDAVSQQPMIDHPIDHSFMMKRVQRRKQPKHVSKLKRPCIEFGVVRIGSAIVVCIHSAIVVCIHSAKIQLLLINSADQLLLTRRLSQPGGVPEWMPSA